MLYVLLEIWIWVVAAGLVGAIFGWWLRSMRARRQVAREAMLWQRRLEERQTLASTERPPAQAGDGSGGDSTAI